MTERRCEASGKRCLTYTEANAAAKKRRRKDHEPIQAYKCNACGAWHYGQRHV